MSSLPVNTAKRATDDGRVVPVRGSTRTMACRRRAAATASQTRRDVALVYVIIDTAHSIGTCNASGCIE